MAEERTLGLVRVQEENVDELSKEDLQRRLDETRQSITETVTEIKETVQHQVQAVKETLDWREQFKKRPLAWSAGAVGVGFAVGYCIAATVKNGREDDAEIESRTFAVRPVQETNRADSPGILRRVADSPAYERVRDEVGGIGNAFVQEISNVAKTLILPAVVTSLRNFIGGYLPANADTAQRSGVTDRQRQGTPPTYQPKLEQS